MTSLGASRSGTCSVRRHSAVFISKSAAARPCSLSIAHPRAKYQPVKAAITISRSGSSESRSVSNEKLDEWMRDSVVEIVKNLRKAPLLVHVYPDSRGAQVELSTQRAVAEADWKAARASWEKGESPLPEGVIFVEELQDDDVDQEECSANGGDRAWGIVVQGRRSECGGGPACYLLKTSHVGSGFGFCSTHFCLTRVKSFREKAKTQFKNCWLLQAIQ